MTDIAKVYTAHTINGFALSIISVYIPIYLLTLGYPLEKVILFFAVSHIFGLLIGLFVYVKIMEKVGVIRTFKLYYPLQIIYLVFLFLLGTFNYPPEIVAMMYGGANYAYWMPINLLFLKHSPREEMGSNMSKFFAYPKFFAIIGPIIGVVLIPFIGFWPIFALTILGIFISYIPLMSVDDKAIKVSLNLKKGWERISKNKSLFTFEVFDNIIEESEWFWPIYLFLIIGTVSTPGIVGSLEAVGAVIFALVIGRFSNKNSKKLIPISAIILVLIFASRIFINQPIPAYVITIVAAFTITMFLVTYFSTIYKTVKGEGEEEFLILREIPTLLGRLIVFGGIYLCIKNLNYFFIIPVVVTIFLIILYYWKGKVLSE